MGRASNRITTENKVINELVLHTMQNARAINATDYVIR